ncbi:MAG: ATP-dependent DNA helicase RecG [bacterium ADurb.Bin212]|nr:MAG: ATP-dependent DNA helicase RecG [bacterium ADurb.Bin212]
MDTQKEKFDTPVQYLPGVGPKTAKKLAKMGVETIGDLIYYFPRKYLNYSDISKISDIARSNNQYSITNETSSIKVTKEGAGVSSGITGEQFNNSSNLTIKARIVGIANKKTRRRGFTVTEAIVEDETGIIKVVWFNQPYLSKMLGLGREIILNGKVKFDPFGQDYVMESPDWADRPKIVAVYRETNGVTTHYIAKLIKSLINKIEDIKDYLPEGILEQNELLPLDKAIRILHEPKNMQELEEAKSRMAFNELFLISLRGKVIKQELKKDQAPKINTGTEAVRRLMENLPFALTADQQSAWQDIAGDLATDTPMNRLLNGDVGSGKTVLAVMAAYSAYNEGKSSAIMAPTEILASQHFMTFKSLLPKDVEAELIVSSNKKLRAGINLDKPKILIGTHALLFLEKIPNLALVVVDEQHRFGVNQRQALRENKSVKIKNLSRVASRDQNKGTGVLLEANFDPKKLQANKLNPGLVPHFLSMTATPIPRSLQLIVFGELDVSVIREKPKNRKPIKTRVVDEINRPKAYDFIRAHVKAGRQVFVVVPLIDENSEDQKSNIKNQNYGMDLLEIDRKTVVGEFENLSNNVFSDLRIGMLHGKMKAKEKEKIMSEFSFAELDILVSTSVVEVGVDVPNASIMMIEDAERFGLAQLHQFRGRVGRGEHQSFCFLFTSSDSEKVMSRLKALEQIDDGFRLAEQDLNNRGGGDIFGLEQSGYLNLKFADLSNQHLIQAATKTSEMIVKEENWKNTYPLIKNELEVFNSSKHFE